MKFEVKIEGPPFAVSDLYPRLKALSAKMESSPRVHAQEGQKAGIVFLLESSEEELARTLLRLDRLVRTVERIHKPTVKMDLRIRNLAYSEPYAGSDEFLQPFNPVSSIRVQPWSPRSVRNTDRTTILLDPRNAFGTGKHPTTRLCLKIMEDFFNRKAFQRDPRGGAAVLDLGCGSGILAIAALKMGARKAMGVEIDPQSVLTAERNVRLNGLEGKIEIREGSWDAVHQGYDLILANLVMAALLRVGKEIPGHLKTQGVAVVSGFGEKQLDTVKDWFRSPGVIISRHATLEGWSALLLEKRGATTATFNHGVLAPL